MVSNMQYIENKIDVVVFLGGHTIIKVCYSVI